MYPWSNLGRVEVDKKPGLRQYNFNKNMLSTGETYPYVSPHGEVYKKAFPAPTQM